MKWYETRQKKGRKTIQTSPAIVRADVLGEKCQRTRCFFFVMHMRTVVHTRSHECLWLASGPIMKEPLRGKPLFIDL